MAREGVLGPYRAGHPRKCRADHMQLAADQTCPAVPTPSAPTRVCSAAGCARTYVSRSVVSARRRASACSAALPTPPRLLPFSLSSSLQAGGPGRGCEHRTRCARPACSPCSGRRSSTAQRLARRRSPGTLPGCASPEHHPGHHQHHLHSWPACLPAGAAGWADVALRAALHRVPSWMRGVAKQSTRCKLRLHHSRACPTPQPSRPIDTPPGLQHSARKPIEHALHHGQVAHQHVCVHHHVHAHILCRQGPRAGRQAGSRQSRAGPGNAGTGRAGAAAQAGQPHAVGSGPRRRPGLVCTA